MALGTRYSIAGSGQPWPLSPIDAAERKIVGNKGYDVPPLDPCPWMDDGECDYDICIDDGWDCLSD
jgi:hypothetical protein